MGIKNCYGDDIKTYIDSFKDVLNKVVKKEDRQMVIDSAKNTFLGLTSIYEALYPFEEKELVLDVNTLNPEAGNHLITTNISYLLASIQSSKLCWYEFPYFEFRYLGRGYRFGLSDVAWISTLIEFDIEVMEEQLNWLKKVLSTRGIPSIILQKQILFLYQELSKVESNEKFEKLLVVETLIQKKASQIINLQKVKELGDKFDKESNIEFSRKLKNCGSLIVSSIIDEKLGDKESAINLEVYLSDTSIFPKDWCTYVKETFVHIRNLESYYNCKFIL